MIRGYWAKISEVPSSLYSLILLVWFLSFLDNFKYYVVFCLTAIFIALKVFVVVKRTAGNFWAGEIASHWSERLPARVIYLPGEKSFPKRLHNYTVEHFGWFGQNICCLHFIRVIACLAVFPCRQRRYTKAPYYSPIQWEISHWGIPIRNGQ